MTDLDETVGLARAAVALTLPEHGATPAVLHTLALALESRYERKAVRSDLNAAVEAAEAATMTVSVLAQSGWQPPGVDALGHGTDAAQVRVKPQQQASRR